MQLPNNIKHLYITFLEQAIERFSIRQHKSGMLYSKAIDSLQEHPDPVQRPTDLRKIKFFGPKIIAHMTKLLSEYCADNGYDMPAEEQPKQLKRKHDNQDTSNGNGGDNDGKEGTQRKKTTRTYVPKKGSGAYAIMLVLLAKDASLRGMTKDSISNSASKYCSTSFTKNPGALQMYSAWDGVKSLLKNELVKRQGSPARYFLTEEGLVMAEMLKREGGIVFEDGEAGGIGDRELVAQRRAALNIKEYDFEDVKYHYWDPNEYDVVFIVDNREVRAKDQRDYFLVKLQQLGITVESRALSIGDGLWVGRNKETKEEVVLDYIIERKRLDDLCSSIKDGRYNEQKIRLKRTGINNVFYVVEEVTSLDLNAMADAVQTSMSMTMTTSNFHLKRTKDADDTVQFISKMTKELIKHYSELKLLVMDPSNLEFQQDYKKCLTKFSSKFNTSTIQTVHKYHTFDTMLSKTNLMTTREMFIRMLMTIRGVSLEKANAIQKEFRTPRELIEKFDKDDKEFASRHGKRIQELVYEVFQQTSI